MREVRILLEPTCSRTAYEVAIVKKNELCPLRREARFALSLQHGPAASLALRTRKQQQCIGLPDAQIAPHGRLRVGDVDYVVVGSLETVEPMTGVRRGTHAPHELRPTARGQRLDELSRESANIDLQALRDQREGACALERVGYSQLRLFQAIYRQACNAQHRFGVLAEHPVE